MFRRRIFVGIVYKLRKFPFNPCFLRVLIMNGTCILSNGFSISVDMMMWFFYFRLLIIILTDFQMLKQSCIAEIHLTWSWWKVLAFYIIYCLIHFANISSRIFASMFMTDIYLLFLLISLSDFGIMLMLFS